MQPTPRPTTEAEATETRWVLIEWLRASGAAAPVDPPTLIAWRHRDPAAFHASIEDFVGLRQGEATRLALLRGQGWREALALQDASGQRMFSRAALLDMPRLPAPVDRMLQGLPPRDLPALAASHLLDFDTGPDDRLLWMGDPADPWPLGAWLVGASIIFAPPGQIPAPAARLVGAAPKNWRG